MDAQNLLRRFNQAVLAQDEVSARSICADTAWNSPGDNIAQLFRQLTGRGRQHSLRANHAPRTSESARVMMECTVIDAQEQPQSAIFCLFDHIPCRLVGWTQSRVVGQRYLSGLVPADIGVHTLTAHQPAMSQARELAEDLLLVRVGDEHSRARLERSVHQLGSDPAVLGYLQLRVAGGAYLSITRALRLQALARVAVEARLVPREGEHGAVEPIWLYARDADAGGLSWRAHRAIFDVEPLLR